MAVNVAPIAQRLERPLRRTRRLRAVAPPTCVATIAAKRCGGPEDHALYACACGYAFKADVTTSVGCPHCGTEQAW
jgi:hypothetical protein